MSLIVDEEETTVEPEGEPEDDVTVLVITDDNEQTTLDMTSETDYAETTVYEEIVSTTKGRDYYSNMHVSLRLM